MIRRAAPAAAALLALAGCSVQARPPRPRSIDLPAAVRGADVRQLNRVLGAEQETIAGYIAGAPMLAGDQQRRATRVLREELADAGVLRRLIEQAGGRARQPLQGYPLGRPASGAAVTSLLRRLDSAQALAYRSALARLGAGPVRAGLRELLNRDTEDH